MYAAIWERVQDPTSNIVGTVNLNFAWDASMQDLLPDNVHGILCVVTNNWNQTFTYEVSGKNAYFLGMEDMHDPKYNYLEVAIDLALPAHPDYATTPGHSQYKMVRMIVLVFFRLYFNRMHHS